MIGNTISHYRVLENLVRMETSPRGGGSCVGLSVAWVLSCERTARSQTIVFPLIRNIKF